MRFELDDFIQGAIIEFNMLASWRRKKPVSETENITVGELLKVYYGLSEIICLGQAPVYNRKTAESFEKLFQKHKIAYNPIYPKR